MADRLTQLQDAVIQQADFFCNSILLLQRFASSSKFPGFDGFGSGNGSENGSDTPLPNEEEMLKYALRGVQMYTDYAHVFADLIGRTAKDIETLIGSLPNEDNNSDLIILKKLEKNNKEVAERLDDVIRKGEGLLVKIQEARADIAKRQKEQNSGAPAAEPPKDSSV